MYKHLLTLPLLALAVGCTDSDRHPNCEGKPQLFAGVLTVTSDAELAELRCVQVISGSLKVYGVESLAALASLVQVLGDLEIEDNDQLASLAGLEKLINVEGDLRIATNESLSSLAALAELSHVGGSLVLEGLPALEALAGLGKLQEVEHDVYIYGNDSLSSTAGLLTLGLIGGSLDIRSNLQLTSASLGNTSFGGGPLVSEAIRITSNDSLVELVNFGHLRHDSVCSIFGDEVRISDNAQLTTLTLTETSSPCVSIIQNPMLTTITSDDPFTEMRSLILFGLPSLKQLDLPGMRFDTLKITKTGLTTLAGLATGPIACQLLLDDNPELTDLGELVQDPGEVAEALSISRNPKLAKCSVNALVAALPAARSFCFHPNLTLQGADRSVNVESTDDAALCE